MNHMEYNLLSALDAVCEQKIEHTKIKDTNRNYTLTEIKSMICELEKRVKNNSDKVTVVNAGVMNAGKSSVLNALMNQAGCFKVDDVRTTIENQEAKFSDNIYFVDTPGLEANEEDTNVAYSGYKDASVIIFVHSLNVGELHKSELNAINKIKECFPDKESFLDRFILVGTRKDMVSGNGQYEIIMEKIKKDLKEYCSIDSFEYVLVSVPRYWDGIKYSNDKIIDYSGIKELRTLISNRLGKVMQTAQLLAVKRLENDKKFIVSNLEKHRQIKENNIRNVKNKYYGELKEFVKNVSLIMQNLRAIAKRC